MSIDTVRVHTRVRRPLAGTLAWSPHRYRTAAAAGAVSAHKDGASTSDVGESTPVSTLQSSAITPMDGGDDQAGSDLASNVADRTSDETNTVACDYEAESGDCEFEDTSGDFYEW